MAGVFSAQPIKAMLTINTARMRVAWLILLSGSGVSTARYLSGGQLYH